MEFQNLNLPATMSPSSTQNGSETTNNPVMMEVVKVNVSSGSNTRAKSEPGDSDIPLVKRGRGRPRKNDVGGSQQPPVPVSSTPKLAIQSHESEEKRGRGRPRGSGKLPMLTSIGGFVDETAGSTTIHTLTVNPGEDVVSKIFTFFQNGPRLSTFIQFASGIVSSVVLRKPNVSGGSLRYEGQLHILSLTGSCTFTSGAAGGDAQRNIDLLSVKLAKPDGTIFHGVIENSMIAATPITIILATNCKKNMRNRFKRKYSSSTSTAPIMLPNQDSENNSKVPKLAIEEGEPGCKTPNATENTNGVTVAAETGNVVSVTENVTVLADENVHSDSIGAGGVGIDLESMNNGAENETSP